MGNFRTLMISEILFVFAQASVIYRNRQSSESIFVNSLIVSADIGNAGISKMSSIAVFENGPSPASKVALIQTGSLETNEATIDEETLTTEELADASVTTNFAGMDQLSDASEPSEFLASGSVFEYNQMGGSGETWEGDVAVTGGIGTEIFVEP